MKTLDPPSHPLSVEELLKMAHDEPVLLRTAQGEEYVVGVLEAFQREIELMRANPVLMKLLDERGKEPANTSLDSLRLGS